MPVCIDEPRHHALPAKIDDARGRAGERPHIGVIPDTYDASVTHGQRLRRRHERVAGPDAGVHVYRIDQLG
jgi:hypothetical protein